MKVVAKALVRDKNNKILMFYRGDTHPNFPGHLDVPGGEVECSEEWIDAVQREVSEEANIKVDANSFSKVLEKTYADVIHVLYLAELPSSEPKVTLSWEHSSYEWLTREDVLNAPVPKGTDKYFLDVLSYLESAT